MPSSHSGRLHLTCNEVPQGHVRSNRTGGSMTFMVRDNVICKCNLCTCIMSSFKEGLKKSGQSVLDARAQNLYEMTKIEEERFLQECKMKVLRLQNELERHAGNY